jgi:hypothetical protein
VIQLGLMKFVTGKSDSGWIKNDKGMELEIWTSKEGDRFPGILTLHGIIKLTDTTNAQWNSGDELRIGLEISEPNRIYNYREQIIFYGKVSEGKISLALIGNKNGNELTNWNSWTKRCKTCGEVNRDDWKSGITIRNSSIDATTKSAFVWFSRPMLVPHPEPMDLMVI